MITREQAAALHHGSIIHRGDCTVIDGPRGGKTYRTEAWRVMGKMRTWKRHAGSFRIPLKHGLNEYLDLTHHTMHQFHLIEDCPIHKAIVAEELARIEAEPLPEFSDSREEPNGPEDISFPQPRRWKAIYVNSDEDAYAMDMLLRGAKIGVAESLEWDLDWEIVKDEDELRCAFCKENNIENCRHIGM